MKDNTINLCIEDVDHIYFLSEEKKQVGTNVLKLKMLLNYGSNYLRKKNEIIEQQYLKGVDNIWKIFDLDENQKEECHRIVTKEVVAGFFDNLNLQKKLKGEHSLFVYLLRYERHAMYPNNMRGFFFDAVNVWLNYRNSQTMEEEQIHNAMNGLDDLYNTLEHVQSDKFAPISSVLKRSKFAEKVKEKI